MWLMEVPCGLRCVWRQEIFLIVVFFGRCAFLRDDTTERQAVKRAGAVLRECFFVCGGRVSFVFGETIHRVERIHRIHNLIANHLGHDRGSGHILTEVIAFDHGFEGQIVGKGELSIDQDQLRYVRKQAAHVIQCEFHGMEGRLQDIALIDLGCINDSDANREGLGVDLIEELTTAMFCEALGVVKLGDLEIGGEHHCGSDDRTC